MSRLAETFPFNANKNSGQRSGENNVGIDVIREENDKAISNVLKELKIEKSKDPMVQLTSCAKIHEYIVNHNKYNGAVMDDKTTYSNDEVVD